MGKLFSWLRDRRTEGLGYKAIDSSVALLLTAAVWAFDQKWLGFIIQILLVTAVVGFLASIWLFEIEKGLGLIAQKITGKPMEVTHGGEGQSGSANSGNVRPLKPAGSRAEAETEDPSGDSPDGDDSDGVADLHKHNDGAG